MSFNKNRLDYFYERGGLHVILKLLHTDNKLVHVCLKILLNASKRNEKIREELIKSNIFHLLKIRLKNEVDFARKNLALYTTLIVALVNGNGDAQDQIRTSGCLSYLVYILSTLLIDVETKPLPYKNTELLVYSIIASNKNPRHLKNQTEVGWITPKIVEYLGKQTIFSNRDQIQVVKCFWSFLKNILHKNEFNQEIFLKSSGFVVLFRSMQEIVDERKSDEFGDLLIKMTGVLIKLKCQKKFLYLASGYCSLMILLSLLNTCNTWVVQHVIIFLDRLTQEIPHALKPTTHKQILQCVMRAKIMLTRNKTTVELCQSILDRSEVQDNNFNTDISLGSSLNTSFNSELVKDEFCTVHDADALQEDEFHSDYFFEFYDSSQCSKVNKNRHGNVSGYHSKNRLREIKAPKLGKINRNRGRKSFSLMRITIRRIINFLGNLFR